VIRKLVTTEEKYRESNHGFEAFMPVAAPITVETDRPNAHCPNQETYLNVIDSLVTVLGAVTLIHLR